MKLSLTQVNMLYGVRDHNDTHHFVRGQAQHGGAQGTRASLQRLGLLDAKLDLTEAAEAELARRDALCKWCGHEQEVHRTGDAACPRGGARSGSFTTTRYEPRRKSCPT